MKWLSRLHALDETAQAPEGGLTELTEAPFVSSVSAPLGQNPKREAPVSPGGG